ncbi:MAG: hypothetical protein IJK12_09680 [Clostridia bacterium]|nr:hypothetical protein [Clostridia bacterium]MBR0437500.1 hypothetical protein [Clostridia bacterium]
MKQFFAILIAALLLLAVGCAQKPSIDGPDPDAKPVTEGTTGEQGDIELPEIGGDMPVVGGWKIIGEGRAQLPEEAEQAFRTVTEKLLGATYVPVAYLGSQIVAGMNYAILCTRTLVTANPVTDLAVITVYVDLEGNAELLNIADFDLGAYAQAEDAGAPELLDGGWQAPESAEAMDAMPQEAATAYAKALEGFVGNNLTPVALLGTQLVAGTNYAFLCHSSLVTLEPVVSMQVVVIYADLSGNATITNIVTVNPADFN